MLDVVIAGAGPAGAMAAWVAARAGARVLIVDREVFPRDKLCGDTLNPGALALLASEGLDTEALIRAGRGIAGMVVTGAGASVQARYGADRPGLAVTRRTFDAWLLEQAIGAGAHFEPNVRVKGPLLDEAAGSRIVRGLVMARRDTPDALIRMPGAMTIAADGRRSALARALGLIDSSRVRRWAFGTYASGIEDVSDLGEMHIRPGRYVGLARITDDLVNVCVVTGPRPDGGSPLEIIRRAMADDPAIRTRCERAKFEAPVRVLGPLAVEARAAGVDGLLLAGDAAGFVDPMTGDGVHLALRGGVLAAREALGVLDSGDYGGAVARLAEARRRHIAPKQRFGRALRRLVESPAVVAASGMGARVAPGVIRWVIRYAGDAA